MSAGAIFRFWLPLAAMWLMMSLEHTIIAAVIARLPDPALNLAAFGLTFALALIVESPVIMLLTAGTALATDLRAYRSLVRFTAVLALAMTLVHLGIGLWPAGYRFVLLRLIGAPEALVEPSRMAFLAMSAWTGTIAFRRLWQGVMIRYDRPRAASLTTVFRLIALGAICLVLLRAGQIAGATVGGLALSVGVITGMIAAGVLVRPTLRDLPDRPASGDRPGGLTAGRFLTFYTPLALTSFIVLGGQPVLSLGLSRADDALVALAVWPVVSALLFMLRSGGFAYQEVVVALLERPAALPSLLRFTRWLALTLSLLLLLVALTPLAGLWLDRVADLPPELSAAARDPLLLLVPAPGLTVLVSWYRGRLVNAGRTPPVTQAVTVNLLALCLAILLGGRLPGLPGAELAALALVASLLAEIAWLARAERRLVLRPIPAA